MAGAPVLIINEYIRKYGRLYFLKMKKFQYKKANETLYEL